ncbi:MAG: hypothetical protein MZV64_28315 [Ignavibacteriales bacterium]|nr:hypothetical protein [Ignavibacteriales bacterium]
MPSMIAQTPAARHRPSRSDRAACATAGRPAADPSLPSPGPRRAACACRR